MQMCRYIIVSTSQPQTPRAVEIETKTRACVYLRAEMPTPQVFEAAATQPIVSILPYSSPPPLAVVVT